MRFQLLVDKICLRSPFQKKRIVAYLNSRDDAFFREAEEFVSRYEDFLATKNIPIDYVVDAYLKICTDMMSCQIGFMRTGRYPVTSAEQASVAVYQSEQEMLSYMVGLGISQFLWSTHYEIFSFFQSVIRERADRIDDYLEIGPGHGLFLEKALGTIEGLKNAVALDISPTSLGLTRSIIEFVFPVKQNIHYILGDVLRVDVEKQFDFITMGEVLEHVEEPKALLIRLREMLRPNGRAFVSTCANCPAIDHVYQFDTVAQIRELIESSGLRIERDLPLPVEAVSVEDAERRRLTINYCALLS